VAGVRELLATEEPAHGRYRCQLSLQPDSGAEEAIFDWAVREGYRITAMVPQRLSLEELFSKLTREGGSNVH
jgi:hypothetical protein